MVQDQTLNFISNFFKEELNIEQKEFAKKNLPSSRDEYWKYTRLGKFYKNRYKDLSGQKGDRAFVSFLIPNLESYKIVVVNGSILNNSDVQNFDFIQLSDEPYKTESSEFFSSLNSLTSHRNLKIQIEDNVVLERPIEIMEYSTESNFQSQLNIEIIVGKRACLKVIHHCACTSATDYFINNLTSISLEKEADLNYTIIQNAGLGAIVNNVDVFQKEGSIFQSNCFSLEGELIRNNLNIYHFGEKVQTNLYGAYLLSNKQHIDNHTFIEHKHPNCESNELYKGAASGKSVAVFNGKVMVQPEAQKTNAFQSNKTILLDDSATINSKPELEIYADDVKCSHGSTTGQLDEEAMFYLQARGISASRAKRMLVEAFIADVTKQIKTPEVRVFIDHLIEQKFDKM